jgi:hypothetical protein
VTDKPRPQAPILSLIWLVKSVDLSVTIVHIVFAKQMYRLSVSCMILGYALKSEQRTEVEIVVQVKFRPKMRLKLKLKLKL